MRRDEMRVRCGEVFEMGSKMRREKKKEKEKKKSVRILLEVRRGLRVYEGYEGE